MKIYFSYISSEIIKHFFIGIVVFVSLISMTQFIQLTEFVLIHDISLFEIANILVLMSISFLPIVMPMSLLFAILLTYSQLSSDSEIIAFNSFGYSLRKLALPAIVFSVVVSALSIQLLFTVGPIARFQFDTLIQKIGSQRIVESLHEKTFLENFFGLVVYFNEKGPNNEMKNVFVRDSRNPGHSITIIAKSGKAAVDRTDDHQSARIDLFDGKMIDDGRKNPLIVHFEKYSVEFHSPINLVPQNRDLNTYIYVELLEKTKDQRLNPDEKKGLVLELHRRLTLAAACIIFGFLGVAQGLAVNRRSPSSKGFVTSVICLTVYWTLLAASQSTAENIAFGYSLVMWIPNLLFVLYISVLWKTIIYGR